MNTRRWPVALLLLLVPLPAFAAITGAVINADGQPIAGARVSVVAYESELAARARLLSASPERVPLESVQADAKGGFSLTSPKEAVVFLEISARGHLPHRRPVERDEEAGAIRLVKAEEKAVTVTAGGKPVAGAVVSLRYGLFEHTARTDEKGQAAVPDIRRANSIAVIHPDFALDHETFTSPGRAPASELRRTVTAGTPRNGRVVDLDGKTPVAGATIYADGWPVTTSGEDGTFTAPHLPSKWSMLIARKASNFGERSWQASGELTLRLVKGSMVSGRVTDAKTRTPLVAVQVNGNTRRFDATSTFPVDGITDAKGSYVIHAPQGTYSLVVFHPAYAMQMNEITAAAGGQVVRDVALNPMSRISGIVVDDAGKPVATATVAPDNASMGMTMLMSGAFRDAPPAITMADGRFTLRTIVEREIRLRASRKGQPSATSDAIRVGPGERKSGVVITIPTGIEVSGLVTDAQENPLSGVSITTVEAQAGGRARQFIFSGGPTSDDDAPRTASDGTFTVRVKEGTWDFSFRRDGYAPTHVRAQKIAPGEPNEVDAVMEPAVEIAGRVVRGGAGVEDVTVFAFASGDSSSATSGPDGSFVLGGLTEGDVRVMVRKPDDFVQETRTLRAPSRDAVIELPVGERITGRVVEKGSRRAVTSFQAGISTSRSGGGMVMMSPPLMRSFTSEDGSFVLDNVPAGAVNIVASAPGYTFGKVNLNVEAGKEVERVEVELDRGVRLHGRVTTATGAPVPNAWVSFPAEGPAPPMPGRGDATTDANGEYSIDALEAGDRVVMVEHESHGMVRKNVTLKGTETRLDVQMEAGLRVSGTVVNEGGSPVPDAEVSTFTGNRYHRGTSRADGSFEIEGMSPGRYTFTATKTGYAPGKAEDVDVSSGAPVRLALRSGGTIHGRITGLEARDLAQANVRAAGGGAFFSSAVDPSGNFRIEGVPAGTFQVAASVASRGFGMQRSTEARTVTLEQGASQHVDLEFRGDVAVSGRVTRNGVPQSDAIVSFVPKTAGSQTYGTATTDSAGEYEILGIADGEYNVSVMDTQRFSPYTTPATVRGSTTFDIDYTAVSVRGRVVDAATNDPVPSVTIDLRPASTADNPRSGRTAASDGSGAFALDFVAPGSYLLTVTREGYGNIVRDMTVGNSAIDNLELRLSAGDGVTIRLTDGRDGRRLRGWVTVVDSQGRVLFDTRMNFSQSGADELRVALSPGPYTAVVGTSGYAPRMVSFTAPSTQNVPLTPGGTLTIASSQQTPRRIVLLDGNGRRYLHNVSWRQGKIDLLPQPGITTVSNVAAGTYTVQLLSEDENSVVDSVQVVVPEGGVANAEL